MNKSLYGLMMNGRVEGNYFQSKSNPLQIVIFEKERVSYEVDSDGLVAFDPLKEGFTRVLTEELNSYIKISEERFNQIKKIYNKGLEKQIKREFDEETVLKNKANLSEQSTKVISIEEYKIKKQKGLEERFYSLSDHLDD